MLDSRTTLRAVCIGSCRGCVKSDGSTEKTMRNVRYDPGRGNMHGIERRALSFTPPTVGGKNHTSTGLDVEPRSILPILTTTNQRRYLLIKIIRELSRCMYPHVLKVPAEPIAVCPRNCAGGAKFRAPEHCAVSIPGLGLQTHPCSRQCRENPQTRSYPHAVHLTTARLDSSFRGYTVLRDLPTHTDRCWHTHLHAPGDRRRSPVSRSLSTARNAQLQHTPPSGDFHRIFGPQTPHMRKSVAYGHHLGAKLPPLCRRKAEITDLGPILQLKQLPK